MEFQCCSRNLMHKPGEESHVWFMRHLALRGHLGSALTTRRCDLSMSLTRNRPTVKKSFKNICQGSFCFTCYVIYLQGKNMLWRISSALRPSMSSGCTIAWKKAGARTTASIQWKSLVSSTFHTFAVVLSWSMRHLLFMSRTSIPLCKGRKGATLSQIFVFSFVMVSLTLTNLYDWLQLIRKPMDCRNLLHRPQKMEARARECPVSVSYLTMIGHDACEDLRKKSVDTPW